MGQQQILLLVLVSIIVGIAIIVGMLFIKSEQVQFTEDEYTELMLEVAVEAQAWYKKPTELGGGGNSFENLDFNQIPCPLDEVDGTDARLCSMIEVYHYMTIQGYPSYATVRSGVEVGDDEYSAGYYIYPDKIEWNNQWEKQ